MTDLTSDCGPVANVSSFLSSMGGSSSKPKMMPTVQIIKRLEECLIPDERDSVFDFIEMLDRKLAFPGQLKTISDEFKACDGVNVILRILKRMIKDDVAVSLVVALFEQQKARIPVVMDFIQFGGLELINKIVEEHRNNSILVSETTRLLKAVLIVGAKAAINEIKAETSNLALCVKCQTALARAKRFDPDAPSIEAKVPKPSERVARVLSFMANYIDKEPVLCAGLDALVSFANNADAKSTINETSLVEVVAKCIKMHPQSLDVVWRACLIFAIVGGFSKEVAADIARQQVHQLLAENYDAYDAESKVQQQVMWCFGSLLMWDDGLSRRRVQQTQACLDLFTRLIQTRATLVKKVITDDKFKPYKVVIPLPVRRFMRETGGELLPEDMPVKPEPRKFPKRRNFDESPMFGTIESHHFANGAQGLLEEKKDDGPREWESALTYGKKKADLVQKPKPATTSTKK